jgi:hypothetical protein
MPCLPPDSLLNYLVNNVNFKYFTM